jgi:acetyl-CoA carboxylase beta subunit
MHNLIIVGMSVLMAYAFFTMDDEDEPAKVIKNDSPKEPSGRTTIISCTTCRKQKRHREIETNVWECMKCKRHIDLRAS